MSEFPHDVFISHTSAGVAQAEAFHRAGELGRADALFREAEALQMEKQPGLPRLYSLQGHLYCDLLLARDRSAEAAARAGWALEAYRGAGRDASLDIALDTLTQARATLAAIQFSAPAPEDCALPCAPALAVLRPANQDAYAIPGLLDHAEALWRGGDAIAAGEALREAEAIAARGPVPVYLANAHVLRARIQLSEGDTELARHHRDEARALIEKHGYGAALPELTLLSAEIALAENTGGWEAAIAAAIKAIRGEPYYDERTGIAIDGGWWDLLPRLEALLPGDDAELVSLRAARDAYNEERDDYLRSTLAEDLDGCDPVEDPIAAYLDAQEGEPEECPSAEFPEISDELVLFIFAEARLENQLRDIMRHMNLHGEPWELLFETKRAVVARLMSQSVVPPELAPRPESCEQPAPWWAFWRKLWPGVR